MVLNLGGQPRPAPIANQIAMMHAGATSGLDKLVRHLGGDPLRMLQENSLQQCSGGKLPDETAAISVNAFSDILRAAAKETKLSTFSIEFAQTFDPRAFGAIGYLFQLAPDLGTALTDFCDAFELVQENTEIGIEVDDHLARIRYAVHGGTPKDKAPDAEFSVAMLAARLCNGKEDIAKVRRLDLEHEPDWRGEATPTWLGRDIRLNSQFNAIFIDRDVLDKPGEFNNRELYRILADRVKDELRILKDRRGVVKVVSQWLTAAYSAGKLEQTSVFSAAQHLGMSERSLHRQLTSCGTQFRDLRNSAMLERAKFLLSERHKSVTEIALLLGYSETSAFSRAFRDLTGKSPAQFRTL